MKNQTAIEIEDAFTFWLGRLSRKWRARLDEHLRSNDLTLARWTVLKQITRAGDGVLQKELASQLGIEGPTLVRLLDSLEEQGFIKRYPAKDDRRGKTVQITREARPVLKKTDRIATEMRSEFLKDVPEEDLEVCVRAFKRINEALDNGAITWPLEALKSA